MVKHFHHILNQKLGKVVGEYQHKWDVHVHADIAAYRALEHTATSYSPNFMFGHDVLAGINVRIERSKNEASQIVHIDKLKLCRRRTLTSWLIKLQPEKPEIPSPEILLKEFDDTLPETEPIKGLGDPKPNQIV